MQVANNKPDAASNVVTDNLPPGVLLLSASAGCSGFFTLTCELGDMASGAGATIGSKATTASTISTAAPARTGWMVATDTCLNGE
ncbi:MAG TPA: hypothetical protein VFU22_29160, partial [Roseiflexaceae bacterium]|nr:hypothetical protein [Roseiflexaceae bacterium]